MAAASHSGHARVSVEGSLERLVALEVELARRADWTEAEAGAVREAASARIAAAERAYSEEITAAVTAMSARLKAEREATCVRLAGEGRAARERWNGYGPAREEEVARALIDWLVGQAIEEQQ